MLCLRLASLAVWHLGECEMAAKRRKGISLIALPFVAVVWVLGWVLYCLGSSGQKLAMSNRRTVPNVSSGLRLNGIGGAVLSVGSSGLAHNGDKSASWTLSRRSAN